LETSLPGAPGIYVQLGAFSARENAEIFAARIRQQLGALAEAVQILVRDAVYRVNLGPYSDRASADRIATQVMEDLKITPFVVAP
jgi:rare lipoprotein A